MQRLSDYTRARDFFDSVMEASKESERTRLTILEMEAREGVRAQSYEVTGRSGHRKDERAQTDSRIDYEARMDERIRDDYALIDLACDVIYGRSSGKGGKGGVEALMGSAVADCLSFHYVDARPFPEVSALMGYSESHCRRLCKMGIDACDQVGLSNVAGISEGEG